jgi:hypothetical protein
MFGALNKAHERQKAEGPARTAVGVIDQSTRLSRACAAAGRFGYRVVVLVGIDQDGIVSGRAEGFPGFLNVGLAQIIASWPWSISCSCLACRPFSGGPAGSTGDNESPVRYRGAS